MATLQDNTDWNKIYEKNRRIWLGLDEAKKDEEESKSNFLVDIPFLPKNLGTPKNVIPHWYERHHKGIYFKSNECFFTWNDGGKAHEMRHTSVFKCPVTGELFGSGQFGDKKLYQVQNENINGCEEDIDDDKAPLVWHRKKKDAEHAAAARALDCLSYREGNGILSMSYGLCEEDPYLEDDESKFRVPSSAPSDLFDWLEKPVVTMECKEEPI